MGSSEQMTAVKVPDLGGSDDVDVIEISVSEGDSIEVESTLIIIESDKATIEVPSPVSGVVKSLQLKVGDQVSEGDIILYVDAAGERSPTVVESPEQTQDTEHAKTAEASQQNTNNPQPPGAASTDGSSQTMTEVKVPDLGGAEQVDVIEVAVVEGDTVAVEATLITVESDKATIEIPSPVAGKIASVNAKVGDQVSEGDLILLIGVEGAVLSSPNTHAEASVVDAEPTQHAVHNLKQQANQQTEQQNKVDPQAVAASTKTAPDRSQSIVPESNLSSGVHAGPAVRRLANELGVDLAQVSGSGPKQRILKEDLHAFVKKTMQSGSKNTVSAGTSALVELPTIDFSQWGSIKPEPLTKIQRSSAVNLHRSWVTVPHVTQFDEADITEMNAFRKSEGEKLKKEGVKLTPLAFIIKAAAYTLMKFPKFKSSLAPDGQSLIFKDYCHIGFAVETPNGLVVPVLRDADQLSVIEIAEQLQVLSIKARDKKLSPKDMQGGCFTISSLGGIGGTQFTPIVNWPEVAILGVSKAKQTPVYQANEWVPRLMLPLSLSYDHRVIDGADAARFTTYLCQVLSDIRRILL